MVKNFASCCISNRVLIIDGPENIYDEPLLLLLCSCYSHMQFIPLWCQIELEKVFQNMCKTARIMIQDVALNSFVFIYSELCFNKFRTSHCLSMRSQHLPTYFSSEQSWLTARWRSIHRSAKRVRCRPCGHRPTFFPDRAETAEWGR